MTRLPFARLPLRPPLVAALAALAAPALAQEAAYTKIVEVPFDDAQFSVEQAITNAGLVIDATSNVGEMLARTKADVGGTKDLYTHAESFSFCSAAVSRQVMEADIANIQYCPYNIFVYEAADAPGKVVIGHRHYPGESMAPVNAMLNGIVDAAAAGM
ncbi:DUF302 domain-containing protein [Paracoccus panacisoli]|uniref:DUF302 domain-containing protein n=2 Tax=Paracoccus TaxID=265 RepID=A0ABV6T642_9RHOB